MTPLDRHKLRLLAAGRAHDTRTVSSGWRRRRARRGRKPCEESSQGFPAVPTPAPLEPTAPLVTDLLGAEDLVNLARFDRAVWRE